MRVERLILLGSAVFLLVGAIGYAVLTGERVGTVMLILSAGAWFFLWGYLSLVSRHTGERPEDRDSGTFAEGAGTVGWFPHSSIWPLVLGIGATLVGMGLVYGPWFAIVGGLVVFTGIMGLAIESQSRTQSPE